MKRLMVCVVLSGVLSGVVIACGNEQAEQPAAPTAAPPEPAPAPEPEPAPEPAAEPTRGGTAGGAEPAPEPCGGEGQPMCPLQEWMENNTTPAVEARDLPALAKAYRHIAIMAPDESWNEGDNGWRQISERGAAAAEGGDFRGAKAACKSCHKAWRERYQSEHLHRPVPPAPQ